MILTKYTATNLLCALALFGQAHGVHVRARDEPEGQLSRAGGMYPDPKPEGAKDSIKIQRCAEKVLWRAGKRGEGGPIPDELVFDEKGLHALIVPSVESQISKPDQKEVTKYMNLKSRILFLYHMAKFDWWGLQARFVFDEVDSDCQKDFSIGFSHPAVPATALPLKQLIPIKLKDQPYAKFFALNEGEPISSSWLASLLTAMEEEEKRRSLPTQEDVTETLRRSLELFSNITAVAKAIEFQGDTHALPKDAQNVLLNSDQTPVFLTYSGKGQMGTDETRTLSVSGPTGLDDFTKAEFKNYKPRSKKGGSKPDDGTFQLSADIKGAFTGPGPKPILNADELKARKYTLIYLEGAETDVLPSETGDKRAELMKQPWTMFSGDRFM